jgi:hypothetical protein
MVKVEPSIDIASDTIGLMGSGDKIVSAMRNNPRDCVTAKFLPVARLRRFTSSALLR